MDIYCTRPHCEHPLNSFADLDDRTLWKTVPQMHCANCEMPLILDERYAPQKLLQQSRDGAIFLGCDLQTPALNWCTIAQIAIDPSLTTAQLEVAIALFHHEAGVLAKLGKHPKIPRLFAAVELDRSAAATAPDRQFFYLVHEYIAGQNLEQELLAKGKFTESEVVLILREVLRTLEFVHFQEVIHRDLTPANIIRDLEGKIYLTNFGAVKQIGAEAVRATAGQVDSNSISTSPNQLLAKREQSIDPASDLATLAVTCVNLLTGKEAQDVVSKTRNWQWRTPDLQVSDALAAILARMLQQVPTDRCESARDVLDILDDTWSVPALSITTASIPSGNTAAGTTTMLSATPAALADAPSGRLTPPRTELLPDRDLVEFDRADLDLDNLLLELDAPLQFDNSFVPIASAPIQIYQAPVAADTYIQIDRKPWLPLGILATGIVAVLALSIPKLWSSPPAATPVATTNDLSSRHSSVGERILVSNEGTRDSDKFKELKKAGVLAIATKNYPEAVTKFRAALADNPNSPETRIYLNNALIGDRPSYTIAVAAPIARSLDRASEMLRGFAQAQAEMNQLGTVNEPKIKLRVVDDSDDPKTIESIAASVVARPEILGIVGHNRNDVTMKAASIYDRNKLPFIAPMSTANELTSVDKPYIFRTNLKGDAIASKLVDRLIDVDRKRKVAIFYVPSISYNDEFKNQFATKLTAKGGEVVGTFKFSTVASYAPATATPPPPFDADAYITQAKALGAEAILLLPVGRSSREALKILRLRASRYPELSVVSDTALYNLNTLKAGSKAEGLIMGVSWQESESTPQFSTGAKQLWNTQVNWATATSYNAVKAVGTAIEAQASPSRESVMKSLSKDEFMGASGRFQFTNGEPTERYILVKVAKTPRNYKYSSSTGYDFVPID